MAEPDFVTAILRGAATSAPAVSGHMDIGDVEGDIGNELDRLVAVGALTDVGADAIKRKVRKHAQTGSSAHPFERSSRDTARRAPCGFVEDGSGAFFATVGAGLTSTMRAKVSRVAHVNRLLIVPSAPGLVLDSIKVGDEEQLLASGCPVEIYSAPALTDTLPDNFSPLGPALDLIVTLRNTTGGSITATIGFKAECRR